VSYDRTSRLHKLGSEVLIFHYCGSGFQPRKTIQQAKSYRGYKPLPQGRKPEAASIIHPNPAKEIER
jgi:hypothetical protein